MSNKEERLGEICVLHHMPQERLNSLTQLCSANENKTKKPAGTGAKGTNMVQAEGSERFQLVGGPQVNATPRAGQKRGPGRGAVCRVSVLSHQECPA